MADNLNFLLKELRNNAESKFRNLFAEAENYSEEIGEEINIQRVANWQMYRANYLRIDPQEYFRIAIYIPSIDHFIYQLEVRFLAHIPQLNIV